MKRLKTTFLDMTTTILLSFLFLLTPNLAESVDDAIIAVVNDEIITLKDLQDYVRSTYVSLVAEGTSNEDIARIMQEMEINGLNKLIEDKLMISHANNIGLQIRKKLINQRVDEIRAKYSSEQEFMDALIKHGANLSDMNKKIENQLKIKYVIDHEVRSKIYVNPQEVTNYYQKHIDQYKDLEKAKLDSIFISFTKGKERAQTRVEEIHQKLEEGTEFSQLIKEYSDSASIGTVERGQFLPEIENAVFDLDIGEISAPITVENGIYIFKLDDIIPADTTSLIDVKEKIYNLIFQQKFRKNFKEWIDKLKQDAYIDIKQ